MFLYGLTFAMSLGSCLNVRCSPSVQTSLGMSNVNAMRNLYSHTLVLFIKFH